MGTQLIPKPVLSAVRWAITLTILTACTGGDQPGEPTRPNPPNSAPAAIPVFYDGNGNPNVTYVSMNTLQFTTVSSATIERRFFEEYVWLPQVHRWEHRKTFSDADKPFHGTATPGHDVGFAKVAFGVSNAVVRNRTGVDIPVPMAIPSMAFVPEGPVPAPPPLSASMRTPTLSPTTIARAQRTPEEYQASAADAFVAAEAGSHRRLESLRRGFSERRDGRGLHFFTRTEGMITVDIVFDSLLGGVVEETTTEGGVRRASTAFKYDRVGSLDVLSEKTLEIFDRTGGVLSRLRSVYSDLVVK
ncbi:MAG: hypothetical protein SFV24_16965 [Gemmatimonadales bacterium]|nr:hypothetical protein [Gemmatimonadales bacterium]